MRKRFKSIVCACLLSSLAVGVSVSSEAYMPVQDRRQASLELNLTGYITPKCHFNIEETQVSLQLSDRLGQRDIDVQVDCNQPLNIEMSSLNGGLQHEGWNSAARSPGFTGFLPYDLKFTVNAPDALPVDVNSMDIKGNMRGGSIGITPFRARGQLSLQWNSEQNLLGGRYSDVIEIRTSDRGR